MGDKILLLYLCTGNSCRSQMAEAFTNHLKGDRITARSAGVLAKGVDPRAVKAIAEAGLDISGNRSKLVDEFYDRPVDYVVTLCGHAKENCPVFPPPAVTLHKGFDDPPVLAANAATEEEAMAHYRRVRDEIRAFVETLPQGLEDLKNKAN